MGQLADFMVEARRARDFDGTWHVRNLVRESITFAIDELETERHAEVDRDLSQQLEAFRRYLTKVYASKLLVQRSEFGRLPIIIEASKYIALVGPRGGGKSAIVHDCARRLRAMHGEFELLPLSPVPTHSVHLVDLTRYGQRIRHLPPEGSRRNVCNILYDVLFRALVGTGANRDRPGLSDLVTRWRVYRFEHAAPYQSLFRAYVDDGLDAPEAYERCLAERPDDLRSADLLFNDDEFDGKFEILLEFASSIPHTPIFLIDNIDRYSKRLHEELNQRVQHLANRGLNVRFIVSFRASSYRNLRRQNQIDGSTTLIQLVGQDNGFLPTETDDLVTNATDGDAVDSYAEDAMRIEISDGLYKAILTRRMNAVRTFLGLFPIEDASDPPSGLETVHEDISLLTQLSSMTSDEISAMGLANFADFEKRVARLLSASIRNYTALDPRQTMLRWHNYSIRSALAQHFEELSYSLSGFDPLFPHPVGVLGPEGPEATEHDYRTMLWRHMVTSRTSEGAIEVVGDVFNEVRSERVPVFFPKLKLLQLLCHHGELSMSDVKLRMGNIGFTDTTITAAITTLRQSRGFESGGFIRADAPEELVASALDDETTIKIRPAGRYFVSHLVPSCELLFWAAMTTHFSKAWRIDIKEITGGRTSIDPELVASDAFRCTVALRFVRYWILPRCALEAEMEAFDEDRRSAQIQHFEADFTSLETSGRWFLPFQMVRRLRGFVLKSGIPVEDRKRLLGSIGELDALCEQRYNMILANTGTAP